MFLGGELDYSKCDSKVFSEEELPLLCSLGRQQSRGRGGRGVVSRALWVRLWSEEESLQFNLQVPNLDGFYVRSFILG